MTMMVMVTKTDHCAMFQKYSRRTSRTHRREARRVLCADTVWFHDESDGLSSVFSLRRTVPTDRRIVDWEAWQ